MTPDREIDERDVRLWFMKTDLAQAMDTLKVVEGIIEARLEYQPKRKRQWRRPGSRVNDQEVIDLKELGKP